jgi:hypothetical protein
MSHPLSIVVRAGCGFYSIGVSGCSDRVTKEIRSCLGNAPILEDKNPISATISDAIGDFCTWVTHLSMQSTYTPNLSKMPLKIDILDKPVDAVDTCEIYVEKIAFYRHVSLICR